MSIHRNQRMTRLNSYKPSFKSEWKTMHENERKKEFQVIEKWT